MSQRRQKKELSTMDNVASLSDQELRAALKKFDVTAGPITDSTRNLYRKKLASIIEVNEDPISTPRGEASPAKTKSTSANSRAVEFDDDDDDDDTSDEDFSVKEEELDEDEEDEDEEFDDDEEEEDLMSELQDGDVTLSRDNITGYGDLTTRTIEEPGASANRISRNILVSLVTFFIIIFSLYVNREDKKLRSILPYAILFAFIASLAYITYKTFSYYRSRRNEENKRVCELVSQALELLQSPDNPKGLMPILHIRDTLLTPAERKTKKMIQLWTKTVKFIEEHESRVKVELINIDGEDFRAWKWIGGSLKL